MKQITIIRPDDWHLHLRDHSMLQAVLPHTARQFARAVVMPNLKPPVTTVRLALAYRERIVGCLPPDSQFQPLMALYLTDSTAASEVERVAETPNMIGFKLYPAGATTHSDAGVRDLENLYPTIEAMERYDVPLLIHGEITDSGSDIFDREKLFIEQHFEPLVRHFPRLRAVFEHVTTEDAIHFVKQGSERIGATITAHHLLYNRNALLAGGIRPHHYCLPVLKREKHRQALLDAATSGHPRFFLGTDSAPHGLLAKQSSCGCAGCYTAHAALELYAEMFEGRNRLDKLEAFASINGAHYYGLPINKETVTLEKAEWRVPSGFPVDRDKIIPIKAGEKLSWKLKDSGCQ